MKRILSTLLISLVAIATMAQVPNYVPTNGLVGYWPFNGNANDESGNANNAINTGGILTSDRFGSIDSAYHLHNLNDQIAVTNCAPSFNNLSQSISLWVRLPNQFNYSSLALVKNGVPYSNGFDVFIDQNDAAYGPNNYLVGYLVGSGQAVTFITNQSELGQWVNIVATYDGAFIKIFMNTVLKGSVSFSASLNTPNNDLLFSFWDNMTAPVVTERMIDDIGIWNRALTECEIQDLYNAQLNAPTVDLGADTLGLCAGDSILLDAGAGYNYYDWSTGDNTQSIYASTTGNYSVTVGDSVGVDNDYSLSFDGVDDYVDLGSQLDISGDFTIEAFVKSSNSLNVQTIFCKSDETWTSNGSPKGYMLEMAGGVLNFGYRLNNDDPWTSINATTTINDNQWHNVVVTRTNNDVKLFIDGVFDGSGIFSGDITFPTSVNTYIGKWWNGGGVLNNGYLYEGLVERVSLWNTALTESEIQQYMSCPPSGNETGLVGYWNFEEGSGTTALDQTSNGNNGTINGAIYSTDVPEQVCVSCTATDSVYVDVLNAQITQNDTTICFGDSVVLSVGTSTSNACALPTNLQNGLVGYWPFCGNANDESGNGNNGTVNGATLTTDRFGNANSAYSFDGNDFVEVTPLILPSINNKTQLTFSYWFNASATSQGAIWGHWSNNNGGVGVNCGSSSGYGGGSISTSNYSGCCSYVSGQITPYSTWHLVTIVFDASQLNNSKFKIFIDGVYNTTAFGIANATTGNGTSLFFGRRNIDFNNFGDYFTGLVDDLAVWNRALTNQEIQELYTGSTTTPANSSYLWSTGDTTASITVSPSQTTTYYVTQTQNGVSCTDSVTVTVSNPTVDLGADTLGLCAGDSILLDAGAGYNYYDWSTGDNTQSIYASSTGNYSVTVGDSVGVDNDYSMSFDGVDDYVDLSPINFTNENEITIELWINPGDITSQQATTILRQDYGDWFLIFEHNGGLAGPGTIINFGLTTTNGFEQNYAFIDPSLWENQWVHLAATYDGTSSRIYKNGIEILSSSLNSGQLVSSSGYLNVGRFGSTSPAEYFHGKTDELNIWNTALDSNQIQQYMSCPPTGSETGLVGYWNFEEGSGTTALDQTSNGNDGNINGATYSTDVPEQTCLGCTATDSIYLDVLNAQIAQNDTTICFGDSVQLSVASAGAIQECSLPASLQNGLVGYWPFCGNANDESGNGNNGTVNGATLTTDRFGNANNAYNFNGSTDYIEAPSSPSLQVTSAYTISLWFNANVFLGINGNYGRTLISKITSGGWYGGYEIMIGETNSIGVINHTGNINGNFQLPYSGLSSGNWYSVVVTFNGSQLKMYIDGLLVNTVNQVGTIQTGNDPLRFGRRGGGGIYDQWYNGTIDDIGLWNRALSESEIQQLYSSDNSTYAWSTGSTEANITVTPTATTTYTVTVDNGITTCTDSVTVTVSNPTVDLGADTLGLCAGDSILLDAGAGYNYYDWSTGDNTQSIYASTTGNYSVTVGDSVGVDNEYSLDFDMFDDYVEFNQNVIPTSGTVTLMAWSFTPYQVPTGGQGGSIDNGGYGNGYRNIISQGDPSDAWFLSYQANGEMRLSHEWSDIPVQYPFGTWVHLAVVCNPDSGNTKMYMDGSLVAQTTSVMLPSNNGEFRIGRQHQYGSNTWEDWFGNIDEISIWNTALDSNQIQQYMSCPPTGNEAGLVGYWNFEEGSGTTALDQTSNGNDGTINGATYNTDVPEQVCISCTATDSVYVDVLNAQIAQNDTTICFGDSVELDLGIQGSSVTVDSILIDQFDITFGSLYNHTTPVLSSDSMYLFKVTGNYAIAVGNYGKKDAAWYYCYNGCPSGCDINTPCSGLNSSNWNDRFFTERPLVDLFNSGHYYEYLIQGNGLPRLFSFDDSAYGDNSGSLNVQVYNVGPSNSQSLIGDITWSTGSTEANITVTPTATTTYTVTVDNGITTCTDSVTVTVSNPTVDLGTDTLGLCTGDSILLDAGAGYNYYDWSTGDNTQSIYATTYGNYNVTVGEANCTATDSVLIVLSDLEVDLGPDTAICKNVPYTLSVGSEYQSQVWQNGSTDTSYTVLVGGTYYVTVTDGLGCTGTDTVHIEEILASFSNTDAEECGTYTWNGSTYTQSGTYQYLTTNAVGCDSTAILNLTILNSTTSTTDVTECDEYTWNNQTYTQSGAYTFQSTNSAGCDSTATLNLTILNSTTSTTDITECDEYTWNNQTYAQGGTYTFVTTNAEGCDSTATLNLTILNSTISTTDVTECDEYTWNNQTYTQSGTYTFQSTNAEGCDSTATLNLTILNSTTSTTDVTECDEYTWSNQTYTQSGTYTFQSTNAEGCDSTATLNLTILNSTTGTTDVTECDEYTWNNQTYTQSGTYTFQSTNAEGCDSTATLNLTILNSTSSTTDVTECDEYTWNNQAYTQSGTYTFLTANSEGCDSTATLNLTILNSTTSTTDVTECDEYTWNNQSYTQSGTYTFQTINAENCDSTATLNLTIFNSTTSTTDVTECDEYTWNNQSYTQSGTYTFQTTNSAGCDSTATLNLTILNGTTSTTEVTECDEYIWNGSTYTVGGVYTYTSTNAVGCDSVATLNLTLGYSTSTTIEIAECDEYTWNNQTYTQSGTYTYQDINAEGCDGVATLVLTISNSTSSTTDITECDEYTWNNQTYIQSGTYTFQSTNSEGCDSTATLNLTILNGTSSTMDVTECDEYTWNNQAYTQSGTYTFQSTNSEGCDSTATLNLTILNSTTSTTDVTECDEYTWNNQTYTQSGTYTFLATNSVGCDSTATLNLTILNSATSTTDVTECNEYTWNNQTYTQSGTYTFQSISSEGCDSTATLNLTIFNGTSSTTDVTECDEYTWNNQTYTQGGTYTFQVTNSEGCDSTATLNLTILNSTSSTTDVTECDEYTWNNQSYTQSGTYTFQTTNSEGCDSTATLNLTLGYSNEYVTEIAICQGDTVVIDGTSYTEATTLTETYVGALGCDSVDITNIVVEDPVAFSISGPITATSFTEVSYNINQPFGNYTVVWDVFNGTLTSGQGTSLVDIQWGEIGFGQVFAELSNGVCTVYDTLNIGAVGISELSDEGWMIVPNPSDGQFEITSEKRNRDVEIYVYDALGALVYVDDAKNTNRLVVDITDLANGAYLVRLVHDEGMFTKRLIKN